jgi:hypothetical protein
LFAKKLALAAVTAVIAAVGVTGVAQGATTGQTCQLNPNPSGWFILVNWFGGGQGYYVYYPDSVVIDGDWGSPYNHYNAHLSGWASGSITYDAINESTCH